MNIKDSLLLDLPMPIYTKRLVIRPLIPGEGKLVFEAVEETRDILKAWLPWVNSVKSWQDSERTVREFYADFIKRKAVHLAIFYKDKFVGMCGFNEVFWNIPSSHIGYWCRLSAQGQGFIQESIAAITYYAFKEMKLERRSILCDDKNLKSMQVAEKLGYQLEARALGLNENFMVEGLIMGRRYVRFNCEGIDTENILW